MKVPVKTVLLVISVTVKVFRLKSGTSHSALVANKTCCALWCIYRLAYSASELSGFTLHEFTNDEQEISIPHY